MIGVIKKVINTYHARYSISPLDLADFSETNRLHSKVLSIVLFIFGFADLVGVFVLHYSNLHDYILHIIYFGMFTLVSILAFLISTKVKNVTREKAYIHKNIAFYLCLFWAIAASIYNFHILNHPFNGVLTLFLTISVVLSMFYIPPIIFLIAFLLGLGPMFPRIYEEFGVSGLADAVLIVVVMFYFSLYKRRVEKQYLTLLKKQKKSLVAKTFGNFTLLYDNKVIKFSRTKSTELVAYLIYKNGSSVQTKELISVLYGDYADSARYGANLRLLISDVKHTLSELGIQNFFVAEYNNFRINPEVVQCDYYDFLAGETKATKAFAGEFMSQYSWAEDTVAFLERKVLA
jgi:hypothetical protein